MEASQNEETLADAQRTLDLVESAETEALDSLEAERAKLNQALASLKVNQKKLREALALVAAKETELEAAYRKITVDRGTIEAHLAELAILQSLRDKMRAELLAAEGTIEEQDQISNEAQAQIALLNRQIAVLRQQLARLSVALEVSEAENDAQDVQIFDLGKRLNAALATKVQELARYRSDFFGRLRELLGDRQDIRIVRRAAEVEELVALG